MTIFTYRITHQEGLHARPAGQLVKAASAFPCSITLQKGQHTANAKGIFALLGMNVRQGEQVTVSCCGEREREAAAFLQKFFAEKL